MTTEGRGYPATTATGDMPAPQPRETTESGITDVEESEEVLPFRYSVTSYGADFLVDGLVARLRSGDITIPTFDPAVETASGIEGFQRGFVWTKVQADGFVESLLLGLPVPGIFLVKEPSGVLLVLDGQQRLRTLWSFYDGVFRGREYTLSYVQEPFRGRTYRTLDDEDRRRLDNAIIHATIVRQEEPTDDQSAIYLIFERLNTGGTQLQPQEIRAALYRGTLLRLIRDLNLDDNWRRLVGPASPRLKDQELILRFFALYEQAAAYRRPMIGFLNWYMGANRNPAAERLGQLTDAFTQTTSAIYEAIGDRAFRLAATVNAAVLDSVMVGVADRLRTGPITDGVQLELQYGALLEEEQYLASVQRATADEESVRTRLRLAQEAFASVE